MNGVEKEKKKKPAFWVSYTYIKFALFFFLSQFSKDTKVLHYLFCFLSLEVNL